MSSGWCAAAAVGGAVQHARYFLLLTGTLLVLALYFRTYIRSVDLAEQRHGALHALPPAKHVGNHSSGGSRRTRRSPTLQALGSSSNSPSPRDIRCSATRLG